MTHLPSPARRRVLKQISLASLAGPFSIASLTAAAQEPVTVRVARNDYFELTGFGQYSGSLEKDLAAKGYQVSSRRPQEASQRWRRHSPPATSTSR